MARSRPRRHRPFGDRPGPATMKDRARQIDGKHVAVMANEELQIHADNKNKAAITELVRRKKD